MTDAMPSPRKRYSQARRLLWVYQALANARGGLTMSELMERTGVTRRTLNRDLALLQEDHLVQVRERDDEGRKRWVLLPAGRASTIAFSHSELLALYLGRSMLAFARGTELYNAMRGAFDKVADRLASHAVADLRRKLYAVPDAPPVGTTGERFDDVLNEALTAVLRGSQLSLHYPDSATGAELQLRVDPLTLVYYRGRLYLVAHSEHHGAVRPFALHRALDATRLRGTVSRVPEDYDPETYFSGQFGIFGGSEPVTIRVRFHGGAARYARERLWHASQQTTDLADGGCELTWSMPVTPDLLSWLRSYGSAVEVLEPASLRDQLAADLRAALARYTD